MRSFLILLLCLLCGGCLQHRVSGTQQIDHTIGGTQQHEHNVHHGEQRIDVHIWRHRRREKSPR